MSDSYENNESSFSKDSEEDIEIDCPQSSIHKNHQMQAPKPINVPILAPPINAANPLEATQHESTVQENVHPFSNLQSSNNTFAENLVAEKQQVSQFGHAH